MVCAMVFLGVRVRACSFPSFVSSGFSLSSSLLRVCVLLSAHVGVGSEGGSTIYFVISSLYYNNNNNNSVSSKFTALNLLS